MMKHRLLLAKYKVWRSYHTTNRAFQDQYFKLHWSCIEDFSFQEKSNLTIIDLITLQELCNTFKITEPENATIIELLIKGWQPIDIIKELYNAPVYNVKYRHKIQRAREKFKLYWYKYFD